MLAEFLTLALLGLGAAFYAVFRRQQTDIERVSLERDKVRAEETRVFEFLRGLGEAFSGNVRVSGLNRLVVEGARRILDAQGGAVYVWDAAEEALVPGYVSPDCPPLIAVPDNVLRQVAVNPRAIEAHVRLRAVRPGESAVGRAWETGELLRLRRGDPYMDGANDPRALAESAILAPLRYGGEALGVLAVANGVLGRHFSEADAGLFRAIAEQSAFALYTARVYSQAHEKKRLDSDLQTAQEIQRILLPAEPPEIEGFEIAGVYIPASHVSGDYFDYIPVVGGRLGLAIADVSGKGVPAAIMMAICRTVLRANAAGDASPAAVLDRVNRALYPDTKEDMFISMAYVVLDPRSPALTLCRAGHDAPVLYTARDGRVGVLNPPGMALGIDRGDAFGRVCADFSQPFEQGDCLVLYTDGVTEALDRRGQEFGPTRLMQSVQAAAPRGASAVVRQLTQAVRDFMGGSPPHDDITLIAVTRR